MQAIHPPPVPPSNTIGYQYMTNHHHQHREQPSLSHSHSQSAQPTPSAMPTMASGSTTRKRKRAQQPQPLVHYRSEQHVDHMGRIREVIVIEDTPPPGQLQPPSHPLPPGLATPVSSVYSNGVRTRAQAAAAATAHQPESSVTGSVPIIPPPNKRRKKEVFAEDTASTTTAGPSAATIRKQPVATATRTYNQQPIQQQQLLQQAAWGTQGSAGSGGVGTESVRASQVSQASAQPQQPVCDDKEGYYIINKDDLIGTPGRYRIIRQLGQGTFGKVVECYDQVSRTRVAVKIIRAIPKYRDASKIEIRVLKTLKARDPMNYNKCIHLIEWFDHRNHICIVSQLLGLCIYDFLRHNDFQPFPRQHIQDFARQLLQSVAFLHDLNLIHTDLKPENILLVDDSFKTVNVPIPGSKRNTVRQKRVLNNSEVRLIDFGSATFEDEYHPTVVSTRHYRAPEIILGLGWSFPCDAFSIGCILVEFYTGLALFQTHDNLEHLAMMEAVMGKMPASIARRALRSKSEFFKANQPVLDWPKARTTTRQSRKDVRATKSLEEVIKTFDICNSRFLELVKSLLMWDPAERITVKEALKHPYFDLTIPNEL
ncbi:dual specificity protein kinase kns1 [Tulasnella sp. 419]|nr:dual specificity protein kinase kns1 [Tulasnella sp. 418]KAG8957508.1 dual specificity protein kinase kns1 [Tulasnella sp. 419]